MLPPKKKLGSSYTVVPTRSNMTRTGRLAASMNQEFGQKPVKEKPLDNINRTSMSVSNSFNFPNSDLEVTVTGTKKQAAAPAKKADAPAKKASSKLAAVGSKKRADQYKQRGWAPDNTVNAKVKTETKKVAELGSGLSDTKNVKPKVATPKKLKGSAKTRAKGEAALASGNLTKSRRLRGRYDRQIKRGK